MTDQTEFRRALLDAAAPVPEGLLDGHGAGAGQRYSVYRNNVAVSLTQALQTGFPVLRKLLGEANFDRLAGVYLRMHPPRTPLMMQYGQDMPGFLEGFAPLRHIGYLPDVARLELGLRRSYHAGDAEPFDPARLASLDAHALAGARIVLAPATQFVPSRWPLFDIWRFNTVDGASRPRAVAQPVLITRPDFDPAPHPLSPAQAACLDALLAGRSIAHAVAAGEAEAAEFDIGPLLNLLVAGGAIADITH